MTKFYLIDPECYNSYPGGKYFYLRSELKFSKELYLKGELIEGVLYDADGNKYEVHWYRKVRKNQVIEIYTEDCVSYLVPGIYEGKVELHSYKGIKTVEFPMYYIYVSNDRYAGNLNWKSWMPAIGGGLKNETTVRNWLKYGKMSCKEYRESKKYDITDKIRKVYSNFQVLNKEVYNRNVEIGKIYRDSKRVDVKYSLIELSEAFDNSIQIGSFLVFTIDGRYFIRNSMSFTLPIQEFSELTKDSYERLIEMKSIDKSREKVTELNSKLNSLYQGFAKKITEFLELSDCDGYISVDHTSVIIHTFNSMYEKKLVIPFGNSDEDTLAKAKKVYEAWKIISRYLK